MAVRLARAPRTAQPAYRPSGRDSGTNSDHRLGEREPGEDETRRHRDQETERLRPPSFGQLGKPEDAGEHQRCQQDRHHVGDERRLPIDGTK
jgi:hypothetical protein